MTYFLDNTFPPKLAAILQLLKIDAVHLQEQFDAHTQDEVWIPLVSKKDYILLTGDGRIRKGSAERAALEQSKLRAVFLFNGYTALPLLKQVAFMIEHWADIDKEALRLNPGEVRHMNNNGKITTYEELAAKRMKKR